MITITTPWDRKVTVELAPDDRWLLTVEQLNSGEVVRAALTADHARTLAAALSPSQAGQWTRADLPAPSAIRCVDDDTALDIIVTHLNAHHPKPDAAAAEWLERALNNPDERLVALDEARIEANIQRNRAERERDAAVARAEKAEGVLDRLRVTYGNLSDRANKLSAMLVAARAEAAEARTAPAVTRDDIGNALMRVGVSNSVETHVEVSRGTDAVHALVSGDDPAVHVVRKSELPTVEHPSRWRNFDLADGTWRFRDATDVEIREALETVGSDLRYLLAITHRIEAEAAVDPVEEKARELAKAGGIDFDEQEPEGVEMLIGMARHVLGREAGSDE